MAAGPDDASATRCVRVKVWDGWIRLFHWTIIGLVAFSWWTARPGWIRWHMLSGHAILALLLWRVAWGFVGSETARFRHFLRSPRAALRHLGGLRTGAPETTIGHNAAGGWMVLAMLALLLAQAVTGLFADDEVLHRGPFADWVGFEASQRITGWHQRLFNGLLAAIALHVAAVLLYRLVLGRDLVRPMITGAARVPPGSPAAAEPPRMGRAACALVALVLASALVAGLWRYGQG